MSWGASGVLLVSLRLLELAHFRSRAVGDVFWFISSVGIAAAFVGLVVSVVAVVKRSGRHLGWVGVAAYLTLAASFYVLHRSPTVAARVGGPGHKASPAEAVVEPPKATDLPVPVTPSDPGRELYARQLASSRCAQGSAGKLTCATCHESDRELRPAEVAPYYRERCLGCHPAGSCKIPVAERRRTTQGDDCRFCHMPAVAPAAGEALMRTDHRIVLKSR